MLHEKFFKLIEETHKFSKELEDKSDESLVEDLYYAFAAAEIPEDCIKLMNKFREERTLSKKGRKKLENLFKLLFSDKILEE